MFCLTSRFQTSSEGLVEVARIFQGQVLPLASHQPGFKGVYLMAKPDGEFMVLDIFDTEEQINAWLESPEHEQIVGQLQPLLCGVLGSDGYEVQALAAV